MFRQSEPGSPLACKELEQYCVVGAKGRKCTPLESPGNAIPDILDLVDRDRQRMVSLALYDNLFRTDGNNGPLLLLGTHVLKARDRLNGPLLGPLPNNQWQLEVQHWHATAMAYLQATFLGSILGFEDPRFSHLVRHPNTTAEKELCRKSGRGPLHISSITPADE